MRTSTTTTTTTALRQRMIEDMNLRNLAPRTQEASIRGCKRLAAFLRRSSDSRTEAPARCDSGRPIHAGPTPRASIGVGNARRPSPHAALRTKLCR